MSKGAVEMRVKKNLDKIIYDQIIDSFILGEYKMDDAISLDVLCEKYEVSRTPVVQAVKLLVNDGVLEKLSNGRVVVPTFDQNQIKNICDVRLMIEKHAIEHYLSAAAQGNWPPGTVPVFSYTAPTDIHSLPRIPEHGETSGLSWTVPGNPPYPDTPHTF